jgi:hypothetical protein
VRTLLDAGDWACAHGDGEGLGEVARLCGLCFAPPAQLDFVMVERLAAVDVLAASARWLEATRALRDRWFGHEAELVHRS